MTSKCKTALSSELKKSKMHSDSRFLSTKAFHKNSGNFERSRMQTRNPDSLKAANLTKQKIIGSDSRGEMRLDRNLDSWFCDLQFYEKNGLRLLTSGSSSVLDYELLELVLCDLMDGNAVKEFVRNLFEKFGGLNAIFSASEHRIHKVKGSSVEAYLRIRIVHAISIRMAQSTVLNRKVLSCWNDLLSYCRLSMAHKEKEQFRVFFLDKRNAIISDEEQAEGTIDHVPVYPRELAKRALELNANALILVHNHPSGDPTPSAEDIAMTRSVLKACEAIGVTIHDHVIIGSENEFSFKAANYL